MFQNLQKKKKKYLENIKKIINCRKAEEFERNRVPFFARQSPFPFSWKFLHTFISPLYPFISEQFAILYTRSWSRDTFLMRLGELVRGNAYSLAKVFGTSFARHRGLPVEFYSPVDQLRRCSPFPLPPPSPPLPFRHYVVSFNVIIKVDAVRKPIDDWPTTRWQCITATGQTKKMIKVDG